MDRRTKVLFGIVIAAAAAFVADKLVMSLWWEPWKQTSAAISEADLALYRVNAKLAEQAEAQKNWKKVRDLLEKGRKPDVQNYFLAHLGSICDKQRLTFDHQGTQVARQGDFKEYVVDMKLRLSWEKYVDLLGELHNSKELLKPIRINISSQYEKDERMDVDLRVSTIEYVEPPKKTGAK